MLTRSLRVKLRRTQYEQISSGLLLKADIAQYSRHVSMVPTRDSCAARKASFDHLGGWQADYLIILPGSGFNAHNFVTAHHSLNTQT